MTKILVVDDEAAVRDAYRDAFTRRGYEVATAENGETGLRQIETEIPDIVLLDLLMPDSEGIETLREMKRRHPALPVCVISGGGRLGNFDFLDVAKDFGAAAAIRKPATASQMVELIERVLADTWPKDKKR